MTRRYTEEFRQQAVLLVRETNKTAREVAEELGISFWTLREWMKASPTRDTNVERKESPDQELARLRRENEILRQEREILKKAAAYFAREQK